MLKRKWFIIPIVGILLFCSSLVVDAQSDIRKTCPSPICILTQDREWRTMNQIYNINLLNVRNPIAVYVINKNPTNGHTVGLAIFSTPSPSVTDYTNNTMFWINATTSPGTGTDCFSMSSIAASGNAKCSTYPLSAAQVSIQFSGAALAAGTPDTADVYLIQGSEAINAFQNQINIRGSTSVAPWSTTYTPAGILFPYAAPTDTGIGKVIAFTPFLINRGQTLVTPLRPVFSNFNTGGSSANGWWGESWGISTIPIAQMGVTYSATANQGAAGTITVNFNANGGVPTSNDWWTSHETCTLFLNGTTTATSQNIYIQDSADNSNWCDHTSFAQITSASPKKQLGTVGAIAGITQVTTGVTIDCVDAVMAAGTNLARKFQAYVRVKAVQVGAGSSTTSLLANCR